MKAFSSALGMAVTITFLELSASTALAQGIPPAVAPVQEAPAAAAPGAAPPVAPATAVSPQAATEAEAIWKNRCVLCHGAMGKGDGAGGMALQPKPRDLTLASWQSSVTDEHIEKIVAGGGQAVGLSVLMPANPDLASKPEVIKALRAHVRSLGAPKP